MVQSRENQGFDLIEKKSSEVTVDQINFLYGEEPMNEYAQKQKLDFDQLTILPAKNKGWVVIKHLNGSVELYYAHSGYDLDIILKDIYQIETLPQT
ncbi:MAG: hypothetical protein IM561_08995 [Microcystis sp. M60BS1]|uniref:hypothetical protein n=1 Tax=unclassified Microcystis TaxID=2643300 RepID=UPI00257EF152|nr:MULTISPECIES: hypothetical protein [unclassified Microcystis]MCA2594372.1 hypothetical protein [Microcystis sp. M38BS1]MCA6581504.1 hypothetical protein [Pseudanabaena sp. M34BS1SP1A06MG]MCA2510505.1 hypothetical protein [Microcystis sp. M60BS1]MCA2555739.1 hypothetical protein [Microcystis sp. M43BS1]MCA2593019.1 hypothetical protein [Microcystis sp. M31BS1]